MAPANTGNNSPSQAHILLVEDEISARETSSFILQLNGYAVSAAANGRDALSMFNGSLNSPNPVDLVITDLTMPVMSGVDFVHEMRKRNSSTPVVVTTGCLESYSEQEIQNLRVDQILFKPFNPDNLTFCVKTILERKIGMVQSRSGVPGQRRAGSPLSERGEDAASTSKPFLLRQ